MSNKARWTATVIAIILAFVGIAAAFVGIFSDGFTNWDKFKPEEEQPEVTENGDVIVGDSVGNGVALKSMKIAAEDYAAYGVSPLAESAYSITATVADESGSHPEALQVVEFSVGWQDTNSASVSEYVTMTTQGCTATLSFKQAFSTPIVLTATSSFDSSVSGTTVFDYAKRVTGVKVNLNGSSSVVSGSTRTVKSVALPDFSEGGSSSGWVSKELNFFEEVEFGTGTVQGTVTSVRYQIMPTDELIEALHSANSSLSDVTGRGFSTSGAMASAISFYDLIARTMDDELVMVEGYRASLYNALSSVSSHFDVELTAQVSNISGTTFTFGFTMNLTNTDLQIASVTMSESNIVV